MNPATLNLLSDLTDKQKNYVQTKMLNNEKKVSTAYILWFLLGVHYFYLGKPLLNILYWLTGGGFLIWLIIDLFRMKSLVNGVNEKALRSYILEAQAIYKE